MNGHECAWTHFIYSKNTLLWVPILKYPDSEKHYTLLTDAIKYAWKCVLMQAHDHILEGKERAILHPIKYVIDLFRGGQLKWAALTKNHMLYIMSVKKYLDNVDISLRSDHIPLKRFLEKNSLNSKINKWAVEIEQYQIKFDYIKVIKNTLADTISRLIAIDPDTYQDPESEGQEYGYCVFEELPTISMIKKVSPKAEVNLNEVAVSVADSGTNLALNITHERLCHLQQEDPFCKWIMVLLKFSKLQANYLYYIDSKLLMRNIIYSKQYFHTMVFPLVLIIQILGAPHDELGHNGTNRTYMLVHKLYFWKGLKASVKKHIKQCMTYQKRNTEVVTYV